MAQERKRKLDELIAANRDARRRAVEEAAEAIAVAKQWRLEGTLLTNVLAVHVVAEGQLAPTQHYLKRAGAQRHWPEISDAQLHHIITTALGDGGPTLATLRSPTTPTEVAAVKFAHNLLLGWRAAEWTKGQNENGVTPSSASVLKRIETQRKLVPTYVRPITWGSIRYARGKKCMQRWRDAYSASLGIYETREQLPPPVMRAKAESAWQWYNYYHSMLKPGVTALRINFDETAVCIAQRSKKGNKILRARGIRRRFGAKAKRAYLNHVAFICGDDKIQRVLPQVVIGNINIFKVSELTALRAALPGRMTLLRAVSSWTNGGTCKILLKLLSDALVPLLGGRQPILLFDAYKGHLTDDMWNACARFGIWPILAPASMTWYMQPLDTHVFAAYKRRLHDIYQDLCEGLPGGVGTVKEVLQSIAMATEEVLDAKHWGYAFDRNGYSFGQAHVPTKAWQTLGLAGRVAITSDKPTYDQLRCCCPSNMTVSQSSVWKAVSRSVAGDVADTPAKVHPTCAGASVSASSNGVCAPINSRTRSADEFATVHPTCAGASASASASSVCAPICSRTRSKGSHSI